MKQYLEVLDTILTTGRTKTDRTGSGTVSRFGLQMTFDLSEGFPLVTTRRVFTRGVIEELLWFLRGETNNQSLVDKDVHFWTKWALQEDKFKNVEMQPSECAQYYAKTNNYDIKNVIKELNAMTLKGGHEFLTKQGVPTNKQVKIASQGDLGPIYGAMWRNWPTPNGGTIDQIQTLVDNLRARPYSRRHIVSGWNPALLPDESKSHEENILDGKQCLPPCHTLFQFMVEPLTIDERIAYSTTSLDELKTMFKNIVVDELGEVISLYLDSQDVPKDRLSCKLMARSQDVPIGTVTNIASYALFVHMLAHVFNMVPGDYIHSMGDSHIYLNQIDGVKEQLTRSPHPLPTLKINRRVDSIFDFKLEDFEILNYQFHPKIDYPISV